MSGIVCIRNVLHTKHQKGLVSLCENSCHFLFFLLKRALEDCYYLVNDLQFLHKSMLVLFILSDTFKVSVLPFSIDPELKEELIEVIEKLLADKTTVQPLCLLRLENKKSCVWEN